MYGTLQGWKDYAAARAQADVAAASDDDLEAALIRGSVALDAMYRSRYLGTKAGGRAQQESWPRLNVTDRNGNQVPDNETPFEVEHSAYEVALRELQSPGSMSPDLANSREVRSESASVDGAVSESFTYSDYFRLSELRPVLMIVEGIIWPVVRDDNRGRMMFSSVG